MFNERGFQQLAAVIINGILTPDAVPGAIENMKKSKNEEYKKMDFMFLSLLSEMDLFNRFGIEKAMECRLLSTTREYRGSGLGKVLVDKLTEIARINDFPVQTFL
jgi:GNAT superfamily N-acetyltransferase